MIMIHLIKEKHGWHRKTQHFWEEVAMIDLMFNAKYDHKHARLHAWISATDAADVVKTKWRDPIPAFKETR